MTVARPWGSSRQSAVTQMGMGCAPPSTPSPQSFTSQAIFESEPMTFRSQASKEPVPRAESIRPTAKRLTWETIVESGGSTAGVATPMISVLRQSSSHMRRVPLHRPPDGTGIAQPGPPSSSRLLELLVKPQRAEGDEQGREAHQRQHLRPKYLQSHALQDDAAHDLEEMG